jgi:ParB family chromosome partitioning protein
MLEVASIRPNPYQPRQELNPAEMEALASSIRKSGLIQPIIVRPADEGKYEVIAGERRWRACEMAGLAHVPAIVRDATTQEMAELALVENIFREDLNAIDRAAAYKRYCDEFGLSTDDVANRLGEDRTTVANYIRLLDLPPEVKTWVAEGKLAMGHARCLLALRSSTDLVQTAKHAMARDLSVRALEKLVRQRLTARAEAGQMQPPKEKRPQIRSLEEVFVRTLGTRVEISESKRKGSGKIVIHYANLDDFDRIAGQIGIELE